MAVEGELQSFNSFLQDIDENLERFITYDKKHSTVIVSALRNVFNHSKKDEAICGRRIEGCPFESLQVDATNFDNEIIWQQIQLQNESILPKLRTGLKPLFRNKTITLLNDIPAPTNGESEDILNEVRNSIENVYELSSKASPTEGNDFENYVKENDVNSLPKVIKSKSKGIGKRKASVVDDQFFKLAEMEKFLESNMSPEESDDNIDYFTDISKTNNGIPGVESDGTKRVMYSEYFDDPDDMSASQIDDECDNNENIDIIEDVASAKNGDDKEDMEYKTACNEPKVSNADNDNILKSTLEKQQEKIKKQIAVLEDSNVVVKPWQLIGETSASSRPANSLLEEVLQFDHTSVAAPVITEETSKTLEDIIIQRIKDRAWDDVERKEKPIKEPYEYKKAEPINQEKSKMSLSEIYEKEYLQQQNPVVEKENVEHEEIKRLMKSLFLKLDTLSNYHFTPKPPQSEVSIVSNVPSINVEECAPAHVSETALLAPEEVYGKQKAEVKGKDEMTKQDRNRKRRGKKRKQRLVAKEKEKFQKAIRKDNSGPGNKSSKAKAMESLKKDKSNTIVDGKRRDSSLTSSSVFFTKLQDSVRQEIHKKSQSGKKSKKDKASSSDYRL